MYCDKCGAIIDNDSNYCDSCGQVLKENKTGKIEKFIIVDEEELKKEPTPTKVISIKKILMITGVIIITLAVIYLAIIKIYSISNKNHIKYTITSINKTK